MHILWLASWYPNIYEPVNGDFIQRHAKAVARFVPVTVIHVIQLGKDAQAENRVETNKDGNLTEIIHYFTFNKTGVSFADKILYNRRYLHYYKQVLLAYKKQHGVPALLHVHVPMKAGMVAKKISGLWKIPYMVSEHASMYEKSAADNFFTRSRFFRMNTARVFRGATLVTNVSATIGKKIQNLFHLKNVVTVHNVVDSKIFTYADKKGTAGFRWLHVSSMAKQKNIEAILTTAKSLVQQKIPFEIVLVGPEKDHHKALAEKLELTDHVIFTGEISHQKVAHEMQQSDAFVLFSSHENFPCVVVEALCCGLPVITSDAGGVAEAINKSNGIVVNKNDMDELKKGMLYIMQNKHLYKSDEISSDAIAKYKEETIGLQFISLYNSVLTPGYQKQAGK